MYQHDARHVDVLVKHLGLKQRNSVAEAELEPFDQVQHSKYRSQVARCLYLGQDRSDIIFLVSQSCRRMSNSMQQSFARLKRLVGYLKREREWGTCSVMEAWSKK